MIYLFFKKYFIIFLLAIGLYEWPRSDILLHDTILTRRELSRKEVLLLNVASLKDPLSGH